MAELRIERVHGLSAKQALGLALQWVEQASSDWGLACTACPAEAGDRAWRFARPGVAGELQVNGERFVLELRLGFLLSAYQARIRRQIEANLDAAIGALS